MDKLKTLQTDLKTAQDALTALHDELPAFHALLTENEADVQRLKTERTSLDAQAQARGRVNVAHEMLEQHQSDIANARAEVNRLEAAQRRERSLLAMAEHACNVTKHRVTIETTVHETSAVIGRALEQLAEAFASIRAERDAFAELGNDLVPGFRGYQSFGGSIQDEQAKAVCETLLGEVEARGADLTDALNSVTGQRTRLDAHTRPLPNPEHAAHLWKIVSETVAKRDRTVFYGVYLPVKPQPVAVIDSPSDPGYSI